LLLQYCKKCNKVQFERRISHKQQQHVRSKDRDDDEEPVGAALRLPQFLPALQFLGAWLI
jgi:hypothetical protein